MLIFRIAASAVALAMAVSGPVQAQNCDTHLQAMLDAASDLENAISARAAIREAAADPLLSDIQRQELDNQRAALTEAYNRNARLVVRLAKKFRKNECLNAQS